MSILSNMIERRMRDKVEEDLKAQHADYSQDKVMEYAYEHMKKLADKLVAEYFKEQKQDHGFTLVDKDGHAHTHCEVCGDCVTCGPCWCEVQEKK